MSSTKGIFGIVGELPKATPNKLEDKDYLVPIHRLLALTRLESNYVYNGLHTLGDWYKSFLEARLKAEADTCPLLPEQYVRYQYVTSKSSETPIKPKQRLTNIQKAQLVEAVLTYIKDKDYAYCLNQKAPKPVFEDTVLEVCKALGVWDTDI